MGDNYPSIYLDWDYDTFSVLDEKGDVVELYDVDIEPHYKDADKSFCWIMGLPVNNNKVNTLYKRIAINRAIYMKADLLVETERAANVPK